MPSYHNQIVKDQASLNAEQLQRAVWFSNERVNVSLEVPEFTLLQFRRQDDFEKVPEMFCRRRTLLLIADVC